MRLALLVGGVLLAGCAAESDELVRLRIPDPGAGARTTPSPDPQPVPPDLWLLRSDGDPDPGIYRGRPDTLRLIVQRAESSSRFDHFGVTEGGTAAFAYYMDPPTHDELLLATATDVAIRYGRGGGFRFGRMSRSGTYVLAREQNSWGVRGTATGRFMRAGVYTGRYGTDPLWQSTWSKDDIVAVTFEAEVVMAGPNGFLDSIPTPGGRAVTRWSPNGDWLAVVHQELLLRSARDRNDKQVVVAVPHDDLLYLVWSPRGDALLYGTADGDGGPIVHCLVSRTSSRWQEKWCASDWHWAPTFSSDGRLLAHQRGSEPPTVWVRDIDTGEDHRIESAVIAKERLRDFVALDDGRFMTSGPGGVVIFDEDNIDFELWTPDLRVRDVTASHAGGWIAVSTLPSVRLYHEDGRTMSYDVDTPNAVQFTEDGWVVVQDEARVFAAQPDHGVVVEYGTGERWAAFGLPGPTP